MSYEINVAIQDGMNWNNTGPKWIHESRITLPDNLTEDQAIATTRNYSLMMVNRKLELSELITTSKSIPTEWEGEPVPKPAPVTMVPCWAGPVPTKCDLCKGPIRRRFFDMATSKGMWGCLCGTCAAFEIGNRQYGPGVGQEYQYDNLSAKWLKVRG